MASQDRYNDAINRSNGLSPHTSSPADLQELSDLLQRYAEEQRSGSPPETGKQLNEKWVTFYQMLSQDYEAVAHGDAFPNSEADMTKISNEILQLQDAYNKACGAK